MHGVVSNTGGTEAGVLPKYKKDMINIYNYWDDLKYNQENWVYLFD